METINRPEDITKKIFEFAYGSGLEDAIQQKAFESYKKPLRKCEDAKKTVKDYIDAILRGDTPDFYETAQQVTTDFNQFIDKHNQDPSNTPITKQFQFGNAQKLINITAKFMFIVTYDRPELRENFKQCHCPLDRVMKDKMFKEIDERKKAGTLPQEMKEKTKRGWKKPFNEAWSTISEADYQAYQEWISYLAKTTYTEEVLPIEFDYLAWQPDLSL